MFFRYSLEFNEAGAFSVLRSRSFCTRSQNGTAKVLLKNSDHYIMLKLRPSENQFILVTLMLVILLAVPTLMNITKEDAMVEITAAELTSTFDRAPASISPLEGRRTKSNLSNFTNYDLNCSKDNVSPLEVQGEFVQFQGKNCLKDSHDGDVEIVNKSNGFTASIFKSSGDKYQTDLIQLRRGDNEITIRYRELSGKAVERVIRVRSKQI